MNSSALVRLLMIVWMPCGFVAPEPGMAGMFISPTTYLRDGSRGVLFPFHGKIVGSQRR